MELSPQEQRQMFKTICRMDAKMEQISLEGCHAGREMNADIRQELKKEITGLNKYLKVIGGVSAGLGAILTYLFSGGK